MANTTSVKGSAAAKAVGTVKNIIGRQVKIELDKSRGTG